MKKLIPIFAVLALLVGCGGSLSDASSPSDYSASDTSTTDNWAQDQNAALQQQLANQAVQQGIDMANQANAAAAQQAAADQAMQAAAIQNAQ